MILNKYSRVSLYFVLMFLLDYSGVMNLYGQNFVRRLINMYRRRDPLTYRKKLKPFCEKVPKLLTADDVKKLQSIQIPSTTDTPWFSRRNTTTHQCCDKFSDTEKQIIQDISEKVKNRYEKLLNKKLYYLGDNKATIYVYHGKDAQHLWHVDPQNLAEIYNVIICFRKKGGISPLQCKDINGTPYSIYFEEGDAAIFNGGTTVHQVPPNNDDTSERTVLSIAYTSDDRLNSDTKYANNMCTFIQGGNNYSNVLKLFVAILFINWGVSYLSGVNKVLYLDLLLFFMLVLIVAKYVPMYLKSTGSGRSSSMGHNIILLMAFITATFSIKGGTLFFSYFVLSEVFFSPSWVAYD